VTFKDAIVERFKQICTERKLSFTGLAHAAGVTPSTVYSLLNPKRRNANVTTVKKLCDGLELSIVDFFNCDLFRDLMPEIE